MNREDFATQVENRRALHPREFGVPPDAPASDADLEAFRAGTGAALPGDVVWFLRTYGGGDFGRGRVFSLDPRSDLNILARRELWPREDVVPIAENGAGDAYVLRREGDAFLDGVWFLDHEKGELEDEGVGYLEFVARMSMATR
jgi:hypothetical protein